MDQGVLSVIKSLTGGIAFIEDLHATRVSNYNFFTFDISDLKREVMYISLDSSTPKVSLLLSKHNVKTM